MFCCEVLCAPKEGLFSEDIDLPSAFFHDDAQLVLSRQPWQVKCSRLFLLFICLCASDTISPPPKYALSIADITGVMATPEKNFPLAQTMWHGYDSVVFYVGLEFCWAFCAILASSCSITPKNIHRTHSNKGQSLYPNHTNHCWALTRICRWFWVWCWTCTRRRSVGPADRRAGPRNSESARRTLQGKHAEFR